MRPTWMIALVTLLAVLAFPERASAGGIPVIYGSGDTVTFVANLPARSGPRTPEAPTKVGYKHYRFHIFWMPIWTSTSEGQFVAYHESPPVGSTWYHPLGTDPKQVSK